MVERGLRAAGYRTGRYTSPHLIDLEERFAIDGRAIAAVDGRHARRAHRVRRDGLAARRRVSSRPPRRWRSRRFATRRLTSPCSKSDWAAGSTRPTPSPRRRSPSRRSISITKPIWATRSRRSPARRPASSSRAAWRCSARIRRSSAMSSRACARPGAPRLIYAPDGVDVDAAHDRRPVRRHDSHAARDVRRRCGWRCAAGTRSRTR